MSRKTKKGPAAETTPQESPSQTGYLKTKSQDVTDQGNGLTRKTNATPKTAGRIIMETLRQTSDATSGQ